MNRTSASSRRSDDHRLTNRTDSQHRVGEQVRPVELPDLYDGEVPPCDEETFSQFYDPQYRGLPLSQDSHGLSANSPEIERLHSRQAPKTLYPTFRPSVERERNRATTCEGSTSEMNQYQSWHNDTQGAGPQYRTVAVMPLYSSDGRHVSVVRTKSCNVPESSTYTRDQDPELERRKRFYSQKGDLQPQVSGPEAPNETVMPSRGRPVFVNIPTSRESAVEPVYDTSLLNGPESKRRRKVSIEELHDRYRSLNNGLQNGQSPPPLPPFQTSQPRHPPPESSHTRQQQRDQSSPHFTPPQRLPTHVPENQQSYRILPTPKESLHQRSLQNGQSPPPLPPFQTSQPRHPPPESLQTRQQQRDQSSPHFTPPTHVPENQQSYIILPTPKESLHQQPDQLSQRLPATQQSQRPLPPTESSPSPHQPQVPKSYLPSPNMSLVPLLQQLQKLSKELPVIQQHRQPLPATEHSPSLPSQLQPHHQSNLAQDTPRRTRSGTARITAAPSLPLPNVPPTPTAAANCRGRQSTNNQNTETGPDAAALSLLGLGLSIALSLTSIITNSR